MKLRVGIMGGTLDPVHRGHVQMALEVKKHLGLDRMMLLPAGDPPHKERPTSKWDRMEMARLAAGEHEGLFACSIEILRTGTTYTVDTLEELTRANPNTQWFYVIGQDTLEVLDTWRNFSRVAKMCTFAVTGRADEAVNMQRVHQFEEEYGAKFVVLPVIGPDISSTEIRRRIAQGEEISRLVPGPVEAYIREKGLYLCNLSFDGVRKKLESVLKPSRYVHTLGVAETARRLAQRYGVDPAKAELAGLLHDCAKCLPAKQLRKMVEENIPDADASELETVSVLHAPAGVVLAAEEYGVKDREILSAIRRHTLGNRQMSALDALIYTADFIEPNREMFDGLEEARQLAETDLYAAMCKCAELTNVHVKKMGHEPHQRSLDLLNNYGGSKI